MSHAEFVHLRVHTAYSLSEGAIQIPDLAALCRDDRMPAVAITDTGNMFGALEFSESCAAVGVQPIIGTALALSREVGAAAGGDSRDGLGRIVLLAQNQTGYANLLALSSASFLETEPGHSPEVTMAALATRSEGLIALSGGPSGALGRLLIGGQTQAAAGLLSALEAAFPGRLYVEIQRHGAPEEERIEPTLLDIAYDKQLPLVATNEVYFSETAMFEAHDALICIEQRAAVSDRERRRLTPEHRFKSAEEMRELFVDLPEAVDNTLVVARRCAYRPQPRAAMLPVFATESGRAEAVELGELARAGLARRLEERVLTADMPAAEREEAAKPYTERLERELAIIEEMGYPGYFLIVADFIRFARQAGIPVGPGRGSGAGSVAAWALGITDLDPLRFGLLFERFLNPERVSMPDFDIDFCQDRRDEVIRYVRDKYGEDRVAQIITFGKLQARAALRDVGRVLGLPYGKVDRICKMVPNNPANPVSLSAAIDGEPRLQHERDTDPAVARMLEIAIKLEGLYRHASTHAAGVVIGEGPIQEIVPLYRDPRSEMPVTQFSMKYVEMAGLVKFDILGLKTLTILELAEHMLAAAGVKVDFAALALDDRATYEMLGRGETLGVFQLESSGMRDVLRHLKPDSFEDIIALVALYRPGPMDNIQRFINCKHRREEPDYLHESIEPILAETYGVMVYQEQVMEIARVLAGYSLGQADLLRRAMGKKIKSEMDAQRESFVQGAMENGLAQPKAMHIFDLMAKFAGYGFNKSHAAAYALLAYQTAWLKANHPLAFFAATMSLDTGNTDKLAAFRNELKRLGIELRNPDVNRSGAAFTVEPAGGANGDAGGAIRYALAAIRNVGRAAMESLIAERERNGPFVDLLDFARRVDPRAVQKRQLDNLALAGAFDSLEPNRARVLAASEALLRTASTAAAAREGNQESLFGEEERGDLGAQVLPDAEPWPAAEKLTREFEAIGFCLSAHPLEAYETSLARLNVMPHAKLATQFNGETRRVRLAGMVLNVQERRSARGNRYAFVQLSDASDQYEITVFSDLLATAAEQLEPGTSILVTAEARIEGEAPRIVAQAIDDLATAAADTAAGLIIHLDDDAGLAPLKDILGDAGHGRGAVRFRISLQSELREVEVSVPGGFAISPEVRARIAALKGVAEVVEI